MNVYTSWRHTVVHLLLKWPGANPADVANYHPVSNLTFLPKVLERIANMKMVRYLSTNEIMLKDRSAYRHCHSTKTAILHIFNDIVDAKMNGQVVLLCLLDLSAAFNTMDHKTIFQHLELTYGIKGKVLSWLHDYLTDRSQ